MALDSRSGHLVLTWIMRVGLALLCVAPLRAQVITEDGVTVTWQYAWPEAAAKGYLPLRFTVENSADGSRDLDIEVKNGWRGGAVVNRTLELAPGTEERFELLVPAFQVGNLGRNYIRLTLTFDDGTKVHENGIGSTGWNSVRHRSVLWVSDTPASDADLEWLTDNVSWEELSQRGRSSTHSTGVNNVGFHGISSVELSRRAAAYSSLDAVCFDSTSSIGVDELDAVLSWARAGGVVGFFGRGARRQVPEEYLEERFRLFGEGGSDAYRLGHGLVLIHDGEVFENSAARLIQEAVRTNAPWTPSPGVSRSKELGFPQIPHLADLPLRAMTLLLVLFAILIGPVNFIWVKRSRRPWWLLWTIPSLSLGVSFFVLAYGIFHQGLDIKSASRTITVLDQRLKQATTIELRNFFAGLAPSGLRLDPGSACYPKLVGGNNRIARTLQIETTGGEVLSGAFTPARKQSPQLITTSRLSRLRLEVKRDGNGWRVQNGLDADISALLMRDPEGEWLQLDGPLARGAEGRLIAATEERFLGLGETRLSQWLEQEPEPLTLVPSSYLAIVDRSPFVDAGGLELNELKSEHAIFGILPAEEIDWR